jgi:hypothetical protein
VVKISAQLEFRAKSYARFNEDPPKSGLLVVESETDANRWGVKNFAAEKGNTQTDLKHK